MNLSRCQECSRGWCDCGDEAVKIYLRIDQSGKEFVITALGGVAKAVRIRTVETLSSNTLE